MTRSEHPSRMRVARVVALAGLALEIGLVLWLLGSALGSELAGQASVEAQGWAFVAYLAVLLAALAAVLRGVWLARPWSKAPALTLQLLLVLAAAAPLITGGQLAAGGLLAALAATVGVAALAGVPARTHGPWSQPTQDGSPEVP